MSELLTDRTVLTTLAVIGVLGMFVMLCRARRVSTSIEDATLRALHRVSQAAPELREGLTEESANRATPHLRELLQCVAVGLTDRSGLISWDGEANHHYADLAGRVGDVISDGKHAHIDHADLDCTYKGCPMRHASIIPLLVEGEIKGSLVVVADSGGKRVINAAEELGHYVCTQLALAELQESRERLAKAEVQALRAQISPHFIYNALNTISSFIRTDPEEARDLLQDFAEFTRYSFRATGLFTTLAEELRNVDRYLTLERARYGHDRLRVQLRIAPEVLPAVVPFLVVQPLVENAVRHGLASKRGGGTVTVEAADNGNEALISVEDDGVGMDPNRLNKEFTNAHLTGAHVGLGNIHDRMQSVFGNEYGLVVETNIGAGMRVTMRVPKYSPGVRPLPSADEPLESVEPPETPIDEVQEPAPTTKEPDADEEPRERTRTELATPSEPADTEEPAGENAAAEKSAADTASTAG
ncbi:histidine kinase [Actinoalloteichus hymeniacidonis]|uniref:Histidine kinase n=1 Tax=Actinoalloteichus hymeniacidonis TaxID=340345 RepID=A0AAC9MW65_9PSEU|nr:histidine kinase [Actinoalloteichus hymeniacidonis]MBB5911070.1 two-component system LytT family sensor kinase [Actinoalloteichus hymeniacidonis]